MARSSCWVPLKEHRSFDDQQLCFLGRHNPGRHRLSVRDGEFPHALAGGDVHGIFGIGALAEGVKHITAQSSLGALDGALVKDSGQQIARLDELMDDLQTLIDGIYEVRSSIDTKTAGA